MNRAAFFVLFAGFLFMVQARAETVYVDDTLRVGVRSSPGNTDEPVEVVTSGALLEVVERGDNGYMRVRTASGAEGWVSNVYVKTEPPTRVLLERAKQENSQLQAELKRLHGTVPPENANAAAKLEELGRENARLRATLNEHTAMEHMTPSSWVAGVAIIVGMLVSGGFVGVRYERRRVARRFNGLEL